MWDNSGYILQVKSTPQQNIIGQSKFTQQGITYGTTFLRLNKSEILSDRKPGN